MQLQGEIISDGNKSIDYAGFCFSTNSSPKMLDNQLIADVQGNKFTATYSNFDINTKYYFRSWATNENGYSYGDVISLDSISATPLIPPCSPGMNVVTIGSGNETYFSVDTPSFSSVSGWSFQANSNSINLTFNFGSRPRTKIYTTTQSDTPSEDQVYIEFFSGPFAQSLSDGSPVYVNQTGTSRWEMTVCAAPWTYGSSTFYFTTQFTCPYH